MRRKWEVVILGGGFAGLACARRLERLWGASANQRVLLVSAENYFLFQPFLPEVVAASVEPRHVVNPVRFVLRRCEVRRATASRLDLDRRLVEFEAQEAPAPEPVEADHLVLALGTGTNLRAVPGMMEHGLFLKTLADALALREHIVGRLEQASLEPDEPVRDALLHFVVVGGGYSGVETAGQVLDLLREALGVLYREDVKQAPVVDAGGRPVGILGFVDVAAARARMAGRGREPTDRS